MADFKSTCRRNLACTHGILRKVVHARRISAQGEIQKLFDLMTIMFDEMIHKPWDLEIIWNYKVFLIICEFGIM